MSLVPRYTRMPTSTSAATEDELKAVRQWRSFVSSDDERIIPVSDGPWQITYDLNGVAYPSGILQVRYQHTWNFDDIADANLGNSLTESVIAVPEELPAGYTQTFLRFEQQRTTQFGNVFDQIHRATDNEPTADVPCHNIRTGSGIEKYTWTTENLGNQATDRLFPGDDGYVAGYRYFRISFDTDIIDPALIGATKFRIEIRRGPDPALDTGPGGVGFGSVVLWASGDIARGGGVWDSGVLINGTDGDFDAPTLGVKHQFWVAWEANPGFFGGWFNISGFTIATNADFHAKWGPRLDIPLPWVVTGADHVAPGGIVTGMVTGY